MTIRLDDELHKKLKIVVIQQNTSIQEVLENFLKSYVEDHIRALNEELNHLRQIDQKLEKEMTTVGLELEKVRKREKELEEKEQKK